MEFIHHTEAAKANEEALKYLTEGLNLNDQDDGSYQFELLLRELGNSITGYPSWHPILTLPLESYEQQTSLSLISAYSGIDHTVYFAKGFVTCPYSEENANRLVAQVRRFRGLSAYRLSTPLYNESTFPVIVKATNIELEHDGTLKSRDVLKWCVQYLIKDADRAQVAETWWTMRAELLGTPHGSCSSLLVNQYTGGHIKKILEALNDSGIYGPIKECSLEMFSEEKRRTISETLIRAALVNSQNKSGNFDFKLRGEWCRAEIYDQRIGIGELSVRVKIGDFDLYTSAFYYLDKDQLEVTELRGRESTAEKFV